MVVEKILIPELDKMYNTTTYDEKRLCCIGFANLAAETVDKLGLVNFFYLLQRFIKLCTVLIPLLHAH